MKSPAVILTLLLLALAPSRLPAAPVTHLIFDDDYDT